jgi:cytosine/adenosine deaminase-related metal-dependent hydrolase
MKTLIRGAYVVGFDGGQHEIIRNGVVVFENDCIHYVGKDYHDPVDRTVDAGDCLISPGFINTHIHSGSNAGDYLLTEPDKPDFFGANYLAHAAPLKGKAIPHHLENLDVAVRFAFIHALKGGATTVIDVGGAEKDPAAYVDLVGQVGIRCVAGLRHRDADFFFDSEGRLEYPWTDKGPERLEKAVEFAKRYNGAQNGRVSAMLFPGQVDTCTPETFQATKLAAEDAGVRVQIHAAMNLIEFHTIMRRYRCTPVEFLHRVGVLGPQTSLSHCIFLNGHSWTAYPYGDDLKILADTGTSVSYCPLKYLIMGIVMESFDRYVDAGINLSLGTDTYPKDMLSEMRYAALASKVAEKRFTAGHPRDVFNAATLGGARLLGRDDLGRLAKGAKADIVAVNLKDIAFGAVRDPIRTLVESGTSRDVQMVIVDGEVLVQDGNYLRTSERALVENLQSRADEIWQAVPSWHWSGKRVDDLVPLSFKMR